MDEAPVRFPASIVLRIDRIDGFMELHVSAIEALVEEEEREWRRERERERVAAAGEKGS